MNEVEAYVTMGNTGRYYTLTYKHNDIDYDVEIPRTKNNWGLETGDKVTLILGFLVDIESQLD